MGIKEVEQRISRCLILYEGKGNTKRQTIAKILHIPISEGEVCDWCVGYRSTFTQFSSDSYMDCPKCNGTGKLPDRDIEYAIKKCQEG